MVSALRVRIIIRKSVSHWDQTRTVLLLDRTSCSCSAISIYMCIHNYGVMQYVFCGRLYCDVNFLLLLLLRMLCLTMCDKTTQKLCIWWLTPLENEIKDVYIYIHTYGTWLVFPLLPWNKPFLFFTAEPMPPDPRASVLCVLLCSLVYVLLCSVACVCCVCVCVCVRACVLL